jgi:TatD DNase family protein
MIDAHCHLDSQDFDPDRDEVVARAKAAGIRCAINAGNCPKDNGKVIQLAKDFSGFILPTLAVSPHHANECTDADLEAELRRIESEKARLAGIGETGLDWHQFKKEQERERQEKFYRAHLQLAESLDLPGGVHSRDAEERCIRIAREYECRAVLHCFLEHKVIELALQTKYPISIPTLKSKGIDKIIKKTPLERLFCETDSPWLWAGGRNEPANVGVAYERVAKVKSEPFEKVVGTIDSGVAAFFGIRDGFLKRGDFHGQEPS